MIRKVRSAARVLERDVLTLSIALRDPRTPTLAKVVALFAVVYALSPIDLVSDFIPIVGQLDDVILVPLDLWVALRFVPQDVLRDARARAATLARAGKSAFGAVIVVLVLVLVVSVVWWWAARQSVVPGG